MHSVVVETSPAWRCAASCRRRSRRPSTRPRAGCRPPRRFVSDPARSRVSCGTRRRPAHRPCCDDPGPRPHPQANRACRRSASGRRGWRSTTTRRLGHGDLAVVLLAELPTVSLGDADRMLALLRKARVVDDSGRDRAMTLDRRQDLIAYRAHHALVRPAPLTHDVRQGLMLGRRSTGSRDGGERLDALALDRHQQAETTVPEWPSPIRMPQGRREGLDVGRNPVFTLARHDPLQPRDGSGLGGVIGVPKRLCDSVRRGPERTGYARTDTTGRRTGEP